MAIPWIIGGAVALVVGAVAKGISDDAEEEKRRDREYDRRREVERLEKLAEEQRKQTEAKEKERVAQQKNKHIEDFANHHAESLIQKHNLVGVSASQIASLAMHDPQYAENHLQQAYALSKTCQSLQASVTEREVELKQIASLLKTLQAITA